MSDFTPGPWAIANTNAGYQIRMPHPRSATGMYYGAVVYEEATAHLIAAAPDLLAACEEFVRKVECGTARSERSYKQMKEAIAKARARYVHAPLEE